MEVQLDPGMHVGQYQLVRAIGAGGMGTVFVAEHILLGRRAAIKMLLPALSTRPDIVDRFFKEARATSIVNHPGVVQVFDFGYHVNGSAYLVMELLEGEPLSARLHRVGKLSAAEALGIVLQVAAALSATHACGIVHRDLKPDNVFLTSTQVKLLDFGVCKLVGDRTITQNGVMIGTPVYMAPEQCQGELGVDARSDIYGLGCVLFHALTGRVPFDHEGLGNLVVAHLLHEPPAPSAFAPELPPAIDDIVLRCLAKAPEDRFQSAADLAIAIDAVLSGLTPAPSVALPAALALGSGFQSVYADNLIDEGSSLSSSWFATSTPVPSESVVPAAPDRSLLRIVFGGIVVALLGTAFALRGAEGGPDVATDVRPPIARPADLRIVQPSRTCRNCMPTRMSSQPAPEVNLATATAPAPVSTPRAESTTHPDASPPARSPPAPRHATRRYHAHHVPRTPHRVEELYETR